MLICLIPVFRYLIAISAVRAATRVGLQITFCKTRGAQIALPVPINLGHTLHQMLRVTVFDMVIRSIDLSEKE